MAIAAVAIVLAGIAVTITGISDIRRPSRINS